MERDERLEVISDRIRHGIPVGMVEAIAAIDYQAAMRKERENNRWHRRLSRRAKAAITAWRTTP